MFDKDPNSYMNKIVDHQLYEKETFLQQWFH